MNNTRKGRENRHILNFRNFWEKIEKFSKLNFLLLGKVYKLEPHK